MPAPPLFQVNCDSAAVRYSSSVKNESAFQRCINPACVATFDTAQVLTACPKCGSLLDIAYNWDRAAVPAKLSDFEKKWATRRNPLHFSGVWRFKELLNF